MKKVIILILFIFISGLSFSQIVSPAKWTFSVEQGKDGEATLIFKVKLDKDWHVYSQNTPDGGPLPMVYKFAPNSCYELIGKCIEPAPHEEFDSTFEVKVLTFDGEVTFRQKVKVKNNNCKVTGTIEYQVCKEACIFKTTDFAFNLKEVKSR